VPGPEHLQEEGRSSAPLAVEQRGEEVAGPGPAHDAAAAHAGRLDPDSALRLQRSAGNAAVTSLVESAPTAGDLVRDVVSSPGRPLDTPTSSLLSTAVGHDVSAMRVHDGPDAAASARAVDAEMYLSGQHLVAPGGLDVRSDEGLFKTVHEAAHFTQQARGPVAGTLTGDGLSISDPADSFEQHADSVAAHAVASRQAGGAAGPAS
jgi:hypothetical protein